MFRKLAMAAIVAAFTSSYGFAADTDGLAAALTSCAQDTGPAGCPATYQAVKASECLGTSGNRACLIRLAKDAATTNDCDRAYQLAYACQCGGAQQSGRESIKSAGPAGVCKYLRAG
jgi:hypothetical protein